MFQLVPFEHQLCLLGSSFDVIADACKSTDSIGLVSLIQGPRLRYWKRYLVSCCQGEPACYSLLYWMLFVLSLYGALQSMYAFAAYFFTEDPKRLTMWYNHRFYIIPRRLARQLRYVSAFVSINAWLLLAYATVFVSPPHMVPWLCVFGGIFICRLIGFCKEICCGAVHDRKIESFVGLAITLLTIGFVHRSMLAFQVSLQTHKREVLMLWKPLMVGVK
ncbi:uncharacterized protein LOC115634364 [Scaptodrosophila lebanonensis]|uniref:Uncharacterized protein LOC115634364 n=1 Tax=Drosophila lebanonensis TaxID=7225 RepID=A0A6J2UHG4_DROLE|nr:uncharacterized protein LOC115634364 [Scaptodrosophila lebanonensis]